MMCNLGVESVKIPGFVTFSENPSPDIIALFLFAFAIFSILSFAIQDNLERHLRPMYVSRTNMSVQQIRKELTQNSNLHSRLRKFYAKFETLFDDFEPMQNTNQPWRGEEEIWFNESEFEAVGAELKSCKKEVIESLNRFEDNFSHSKHHFPNSQPLFAGILAKVVQITSILETVIDAPHVTKGGIEHSKVGFRFSALNFDRKPIDQLVETFVDFEGDLSRLSKVLFSYRLKLFFQTNLLSLVLPVLVSICFILFGVCKWLR